MLRESVPFQKQATQLRLLNDLSTKLQSLLASENFYQEVVDTIQTRLNYYCIQIWTVGPESSFTLRAQAGAYKNHLKIGDTLPASTGITGHVIQTQESYVCNDVENDQNYTNLSFPVESKAELCVPVLKNNQVVATLNVESDVKNAFDDDDLVTLKVIAAQVAVSLTNQRLYSEATRFNRKLQKAVEQKTLELRQAHDQILKQQDLLQKENKALKTLVNHKDQKSEMIGESQAILDILALVDKVAPTAATVLIQGESGTGKELIARRLHTRSNREHCPYVTVNCGALQESLLESELFGHEKGSFTGAVHQKMGLCETADGGSLFLDEIGEMSLGIQTKLLRFLQESEFYRIGGKKPIRVNVRVISATNRDLEKEVKEGRFREDLFYRLNTITLKMPPLRKRQEDIPLLVDFFLKNSRFGHSTQPIKRVDPRVIRALSMYSWPGNIRELQNTIERLKILAENNEIRFQDLPFNIQSPRTKIEPLGSTLDLPLRDIEKYHILRTLNYYHGNKTRTAQSLGITIKTLYNKLHQYGVLKEPNPAYVLEEEICFDRNVSSTSRKANLEINENSF